MTDLYGIHAHTHALKDLTSRRAYYLTEATPLSSETVKISTNEYVIGMTYFCSFKDLTADELEYMNAILDANMRTFHIKPRSVGSYSEGKFDHDLYIKIEPKHMVQFALTWLRS